MVIRIWIEQLSLMIWDGVTFEQLIVSTKLLFTEIGFMICFLKFTLIDLDFI